MADLDAGIVIGKELSQLQQQIHNLQEQINDITEYIRPKEEDGDKNKL